MFWEKFGYFNFLCSLAYRSNVTKGLASVRDLMWVCSYLLQLTTLQELLNSLLQHRIVQSRSSCWNTSVPTLITPASLWDVGDHGLSLLQFYLGRQWLWPNLHRRQKLCSFHLYYVVHFQKANFSSLGTKWAGISAQAAHG